MSEDLLMTSINMIAISFNYEQPSSSRGAISLEPLRQLFHWFNDKEKASGNASSATISSIQTRLVSANKANNDDDDLRHHMEAQE